MGFPFPDDRIALGRLDWCRPGQAGDQDALSCILRARMCAAHVQASRNPEWASIANPVFQNLLSAAKVEKWSPCPQGSVSGTCGLLLGDRYGPSMWKAFGEERERRLYDSLMTGEPARLATEETRLPNCSYPADVMPTQP